MKVFLKQEHCMAYQEAGKLWSLTAVEMSHFILTAVRNTSLQPQAATNLALGHCPTTNASIVTNRIFIHVYIHVTE
jgi:hypothetical protein